MSLEYQDLYESVFKSLKNSDVTTKAPAFLNNNEKWSLIGTFLNEFTMFLVMLISVDGQPSDSEIEFVTKLTRAKLNKETVSYISENENLFGVDGFISVIPETLKAILDNKILKEDIYLDLHVRTGLDLINIGEGKSKEEQKSALKDYCLLIWRYIVKNASKEIVGLCGDVILKYDDVFGTHDKSDTDNRKIPLQSIWDKIKSEQPQKTDLKLNVSNTYVMGYKVKQLPYHFVLFYHIPPQRFNMFKETFCARVDDNALLTYCYLDTQAGLSYRVLCCARLDTDGSVWFNIPDELTTMVIMREGNLECPAEIIDEDTVGMERFKEDAKRIKESYGYLKDRVMIHDNIPFDEYRHPAYPDDIQTFFFTEQKDMEIMWVREQDRNGNRVLGHLIDEPYKPQMGFHKGDYVEVIPHVFENGVMIPVAVMEWMRHR